MSAAHGGVGEVVSYNHVDMRHDSAMAFGQVTKLRCRVGEGRRRPPFGCGQRAARIGPVTPEDPRCTRRTSTSSSM